MKKSIILTVVMLACPALVLAGDPEAVRPSKPQVNGGLIFGYNGGPGLQTSLCVSHLAAGFPLSLRLGVGFAAVEPGKSAEARQIFINDATNGIPEKNGRTRDYRFDFIYPLAGFSLNSTRLYAGPRYSSFSGNFKYVGGNEDFSITSKQWGFGIGVERGFRISPGMSLVLVSGVDHYFTAPLYGHDTAYDPDGEDVNPRDGYDFGDADDAIDQPETEFSMMFGLTYDF